MFFPFSGFAATYYSRINGNWNTAVTWSTVSCAGVASASVPGAGDNVIICSGHTITMNGAPGSCLSLTINGTANWTSASTTNVGVGGLTLNNGALVSGSVTGSLIVAGPMNVVAGATTTIGNIILNVTGLTSINGSLTDNTSMGTNTFANVDLNSTGNFNNTTAETYTITGNLNTYGGGFLAIGATPIFNITGDFNVISGICDLSRIRITVSGNTNIFGTLSVNNIRGLKTFNNLTVNSGGNFNSTVAESYRINGNILVNGAFNANLGVFTLAGASKTISGSTALIFDDIRCNGSYTNNTSVRLTNSLTGSGAWTQGATGTLDLAIINANFTVTNFNTSIFGNSVLYSLIGNQNIRIPSDGSYSSLTVSGGSTKTMLGVSILSGNMAISTATTLSTSNFNLLIGGTFTNDGVFTAGTSTVTLNGTLAQTIGGTTTTAFNNLTISNPSAIVTGATNFSVASILNIGAGSVLSPDAAVVVSGGGTLTGSGTARVTRIAVTPDFISQYTIAGKILSGLNIDYIGAGNQVVNILNYGSLTISTNGARTVTFPAAIVGVSNIFSPSAVTTTYVIAGNTINFNGTVAQTIPAFNYHHLTSSSTGARILASSGTIGVAGIFTPSVNVYTITGSTINFNGTIAQGIPAFNYYNLSSSSTGSRTLAAAGTIGVAAAFLPGTNVYTITNSTINFNGTIAQTIPAFNYNHLTSSSTGTRTLAAAGTIGVAGVFTPSVNVYTVTGSTVDFNGTVAQTIPAFNYNHLTSSSTGARTLASAGIIGVAGVFTPSVNSYTSTGSTVNFNGTVVQSIPAFNYYNLNSSSTGARTLAAVDTIGVAAAFIPGTNVYTVTGSTINFNGTIAQTVPAFTYHNLISAGSAAKTLSGNIIVNNDITITGNLDVSASNYSISVNRNWINNGTFSAQNGAVIFNGSAAQTLSGSGSTTFNRLDMNNTAGGVSLASGTYILNSVINPLNGNFNTNGQSFTMVSDASKTARIGQVAATASLSGNFIVQRYITARDTSFADLCSPVQSSTFADWDNELPALSYIHTPPSALASAFTYDESADVYVPITSAGAPLTEGQGFEVFLSGDYTYASLPNTTMDVIGVPNQGDKNLSTLISNNVQGWNLVGNPFASNISWANVYTASGGAASGLYDFIEMYDYTIGDWNGYTSADGIEIGSAQGFWVYGLPLASPLTLIIPESSKTATSNSSIKAPTKTQPYFTLKIGSNANNFSHTFKIDAKVGASDNLDEKDIPYRPSPNKATPTLYSTIEGTKINLNTFNLENDIYSLPLVVKVNSVGNYKISAAGFEYMDEYKCIQLEDRLKNTFINLTSQSTYEFEMFKPEYEKRFVLHFNKNGDCRQSTPSEDISYFDNSVEVLATQYGNILNFNYAELTQTSIALVNLLGQDIIEKRNLLVGSQSETIPLPDDFKGIYFVRISSDKGMIVKKFFKK